MDVKCEIHVWQKQISASPVTSLVSVVDKKFQKQNTAGNSDYGEGWYSKIGLY